MLYAGSVHGHVSQGSVDAQKMWLGGDTHSVNPRLAFCYPTLLACLTQSSARVDKKVDRILWLIYYMKSGLSSSLNVCIIEGKVCRKNNKPEYIGRGITSSIAEEKKKQYSRGQAWSINSKDLSHFACYITSIVVIPRHFHTALYQQIWSVLLRRCLCPHLAVELNKLIGYS